MSFYHLVFFHIFSAYYKNGYYTNDIPWLTASALVGTSTVFYVFGIYDLVNYLRTESFLELPRKEIFVSVATSLVLVQCFYFWFDNRYMKLYDRYYKSKVDSRFYRIASWTVVIIGMMTIPISALAKLYLDK